MNSFLTLWPADWCKLLLKNGDFGPLQVLYGGPHTSLPPLTKVKIGDTLYPVMLQKGQLYLLGALSVAELGPAGPYLKAHQIEPPGCISYPVRLKQQPMLGHRIPRTCVDQVAVGAGTTLRYDVPVPLEIVRQLQLGPRAGQEKPLALRPDGTLLPLSLQGHYRRLSYDSAQLLADFVAAN